MYRHPMFRRLVAAVILLDAAGSAMANPTGMTVQKGSAAATVNGSQLTVTASQLAVLNWQSFNIAAGETTIFNQPSISSVVVNRINDQNPSQIYGGLQANGLVVLMNASGFYFGPDSFVKTGGLIVSTANCLPPQNSGGSWEFNGPPPLASIVNYGQIKIGNGGSAFLIADKIENHGNIEAPGGTIGLAAGQTVLLSERPDGRGMSMQVTLPSGSVDNEGRLIADGGTIAMNARVVNQNGFIQANSVQNVNGTIELIASDQLTLGANSQIIASGDNSSSGSAGGDVMLQSGNNFSDSAGSQITVTGGTQGGNGGDVEISAPNVLSLNSSMDASAQAGSTAGQLLLNSKDITLTASGANGMNGGTLDLNVNGTFANFSQIILQASGDITKGSGNITLAAGNAWDLGAGSGLLTLEAGGDITFGTGSKITDANKWSVTLDAGYNFANNIVQSGVGNIYLNGGSGQSGIGSIQLSQAGINLTAGNSIFVGSGCQIIDDGGFIGLYAQTVNQNGLIQANSVGNQHATIELVASDLLALGANSKITANGDNSESGSDGGQIMLQTAQTFSDVSGSQIEFHGGANGGNDGKVLIYTAQNSVNSLLNGVSASSASGNIYYYPLVDGDLTLTADSLAPFSGFSRILFQASGSITISAGENLNLSGGTGSRTSGLLTLDAGGNIIFDYDSSGALPSAKITDANNWSVTLDAGYNFDKGSVDYGTDDANSKGYITFNGDSLIKIGSGNINLTAGQDITVGSGYVITTGGGSIYAHALAGSIDTGSDAQGYFFKKNASSLSTAYGLSDGLGGISTAAGGDVTLIAGGDVTSVLPGKGVYYYDGNSVTPENGNDYLTAGSGAYGSQPGNVTIVAGGNVTGNYLVANGTGAIYAGVQMDANGNPKTDSSGNYLLGTSGSAGTDLQNNELALSLINGGWNVTAAQNILLQEVRNPNGDFDYNGGTAYNHYFNYAPGDYVNLSAGNLVQLGASVQLPRLSSKLDTKLYNVPVIYPSILNITAGDGGVKLGAPGSPTSLTLFPSPQGSLTIDTTDSGSLVSGLNGVQGAPQLFNLIVSDADPNQPQYTTTHNFGASDHASSPIHLDASTPIYLKIDGDMNYINLVVPEAAQINVGGNMNNCGFQGMNLSSDPSYQVQILEADGSTRMVTVNPAVTSINVSGDIFNGSSFTSVDLSKYVGTQGLDLSDLSLAVDNKIGDTFISGTALATSFYYNPTTDILTYQNIAGFKLADVLQLLQNLTVQKTDAKGNLLWLDSLDTIPDTKQVSVLSAAEAQALLAQYNTLSAAPYALAYNASSYGYTIGGGGTFDITARTIDLGTSAGIQSKGVALYTVGGGYPLASLFGNGGVFNHGADITITTTGNHSGGITAADEPFGDLDMFSSSIASLQGGNISILAGGDVNAGSAVLSVNTASVRGIYSTSQGDVSVIADGDININGSRIMTYDGGNITVESLNGSVNAGTGASTPVSITGFYEDPVTHAVYSDSPQIPFSGIAALTFPERDSSYPAPVSTLGNILVEAPYGDINATVAGILQIPLNHLNYPDAITTVLAGYEMNNSGNPVYALGDKNIVPFVLGSTFELSNQGVPVLDKAGHPIYVTQLLDADGAPVLDAAGNQLYVEKIYKKPVDFGGPVITYSLGGGKLSINPYLDPTGDPVTVVGLPDTSDSHGNPILVYGRNINVNGSGIIASNAKLLATGDINGLIFARNNLDIVAQQVVNVTALAMGNANVSGEQVEGTIVGVGGVNVSGDSITAALISANVSGATSGQSGLAQGTAANATAQAVSSDDSAKTAVADTTATDDDMKKKGKAVATVQKTGRVTVLLPPKKLSQNQTSSNHL
jgi:filamentous hemagglutinin family protein